MVILSALEGAGKVAGKLTLPVQTFDSKRRRFVEAKLKSPFKILALLMAILTFSMPFVTFAQQNSLQAEATVAAERDAQNYTNKALWVVGGCVGGGVGSCVGGGATVILAYAVEPSPPAARLLGKSPEYVAIYTNAYREKAKKLQTNSALVGCVIGTLASAVLIAASL